MDNLPSDESDEEQGADFEDLLKQHKSSYFMFESEKKWLDEDVSNEIPINYSKFFNLDTKFLNQCILSVPFNERHTFDINYTEKELVEMQKSADHNESQYKEMLENSFIQPATTVSPKQQEEKLLKVTEKLSKVEVGVSKPVTKENISSNEPSSSTSNKESIQKWLDDILDN